MLSINDKLAVQADFAIIVISIHQMLSINSTRKLEILIIFIISIHQMLSINKIGAIALVILAGIFQYIKCYQSTKVTTRSGFKTRKFQYIKCYQSTI